MTPSSTPPPSLIQKLRTLLPPFIAMSLVIGLVMWGMARFQKALVKGHPVHFQTQVYPVDVSDEALARCDAAVQGHAPLNGEAPVSGEALVKGETILNGQALFLSHCATCHSADGHGGYGPNLTDSHWLYGDSPREIYRTLLNGRPRMPAFGDRLSNAQIRQLVCFVLSLKNQKDLKNP